MQLCVAFRIRGLPLDGTDPVDAALGGSETAAMSMAAALARRGHRVSVFARLADGVSGVGDVELLPIELATSHPRLAEADVVVSSRDHSWLAALERRPRFVVAWNHDMPDGAVLGADAAATLRRIDRWLFVSEFQRSAYLDWIPGLAPFATATRNGVDFGSAYSLRGTASLASPPRFVYASRPERGLLFLLERIWPELRRRFPDAELRVASYGIGDLRLDPATERLLAEVGRRANETPGVRVFGSLTRRELWREMSRCRAVLYPTAFPETSCLVAIEAQALGLPIVTTDSFALEETVAFRPTRIAGPTGTDDYVSRFVEAAARLVEHDAFHADARETGLRHITPETHSWDALAAEWEAAFDAWLATERARNGRPRVSATILVRNEEANLERCLGSFDGVADEILIGDTGSTDRTVLVAESLGFVRDASNDTNDHASRRLVSIAFEDFAQARNALASHARGEWIYWQDADEVLVGGKALRRWVEEDSYFDALVVEQRHVLDDGELPPDTPARCFRRETPDGLLAWFGCVHETIEHEINRPPTRAVRIPYVHVVHDGYRDASTRERKILERNWPLFLEDRRRHPERYLGLILAMRECLNLAGWEVRATGGLTRKAYAYLDRGFGLWRSRISAFPPRYRAAGWEVSRRILELLAQYDAPLAATGRVPFEIQLAFAARRGGLGNESPPVSRAFFADVDELRRELESRLQTLDNDLGSAASTFDLAALPERSDAFAHLDLDPRLLGLVADREPFV